MGSSPALAATNIFLKVIALGKVKLLMCWPKKKQVDESPPFYAPFLCKSMCSKVLKLLTLLENYRANSEVVLIRETRFLEFSLLKRPRLAVCRKNFWISEIQIVETFTVF